MLRRKLQLIVHAAAAPESDELEHELRAAAPRALRRYENVDVGFRAVTHVVDEVDLPSEIVELTLAAIKKDPKPVV